MKKAWVLGLLFVCGFSLRAEIPFEQLKGLSDLMKSEDTIGGFLALKTGTLERIRFFEPYKIFKHYTHDGIHLIPVEHRDPVDPNFPIHPEWQHPAFRIKSVNDPYAFTKQFEYPLTPISALIQWLFPSVDGALFVANDRQGDFVGEMGIHLKNILKYQVQEEAIKRERENEQRGLQASIDSRGKLGTELGKSKQENSEILKIDQEIEDANLTIKENGVFIKKNSKETDQAEEVSKRKTQNKELTQKMINLRLEKERLINEMNRPHQENELKIASHQIRIEQTESQLRDLRSNLEKISWMPKILNCVFQKRQQFSPDFKSCVGNPSSEDAVQFLTILEEALVQDGTFGGSHDSLYPKNIALHALLGYLWRVLDSKEQLIELMKEAGLIKTTAKDHRLSMPILAQDRYVKGVYENFRQRFFEGASLTFEQLAYIGYGYEIYEKPYPEAIIYGSAKAPDRHSVQGRLYPDCGETALRNFFNILTFKGAGEFDASLLDHLGSHEKIREIQEFYRKFSNISSQQGALARDAWSKIVSDLNGKPDSFNSTELMDVRYSGYSNIKASLGMKNILNVMAKLTGDGQLNRRWYRIKSEGFQIAAKLNRLCEIFSRGEKFKLDWNINSRQDDAPNHGNFNFTMTKNNKTLNFMFVITEKHFEVKFSEKNAEDWRKNQQNPKNDLLQPFYGTNPSPFLNPLIREQQDETLGFWGQLGITSRIPLTLRYLYKMFGAQVEDENAQINIMKGLNQIRHFELTERETEHPWILDFVQIFLIDKLRETRSLHADWFKYEFGIPKEAKLSVNIANAPEYGLLNTLKTLLGKVTDKNIESSIFFQTRRDHFTHPLISAAKNGHLPIVQFLVGNGANKEVQDEHQRTPLMFAAENGHLPVVRFLVENGANKEAKNDSQWNSLMLATIEGHLPIVRFLVKNGANKEAKDKDQKTSLMLAAEKGHFDIVRFLVENGADKEAKDLQQMTILMWEVIRDRLPLVRLLVENGADKEAQDVIQRTPLIFASIRGLLPIVKFLIENGANKEAKDKQQRTPLMQAAIYGHLPVVSFLVDNGANLFAVDDEKKTALSLAQEKNHTQIAEFLEVEMKRRETVTDHHNRDHEP